MLGLYENRSSINLSSAIGLVGKKSLYGTTVNDIQPVLIQPPDISTVIRMAHCEIFSLKTKYFETKIERKSCVNLGSTQYEAT